MLCQTLPALVSMGLVDMDMGYGYGLGNSHMYPYH